LSIQDFFKNIQKSYQPQTKWSF